MKATARAAHRPVTVDVIVAIAPGLTTADA